MKIIFNDSRSPLLQPTMSMEETVLLLAPPARRLVIRDSFCSKVSQADYLNHPIDLLLQSGRLSRE